MGGLITLPWLLFRVLADLFRWQNEELRSTPPTLHRLLKILQIPSSWGVGIHGLDPSLPLHTLISI